MNGDAAQCFIRNTYRWQRAIPRHLCSSPCTSNVAVVGNCDIADVPEVDRAIATINAQLRRGLWAGVEKVVDNPHVVEIRGLLLRCHYKLGDAKEPARVERSSAR